MTMQNFNITFNGAGSSYPSALYNTLCPYTHIRFKEPNLSSKRFYIEKGISSRLENKSALKHKFNKTEL